MATQQVLQLNGSRKSISQDVLQEFAASVRGTLLHPGDAGYDGARTVWNAMIDKRPALIVRCAGTADVLAAVNFARQHDLLVSVRGGGHSVAGHAVCDQGLMIDLSPMRSVRVDPGRRRAMVEPGAKLRDFDHEAQAFGLATPLGVISDTGVAGLTLGGGFGLLSRKHGLAIDNLMCADVVTAEGRLLHASAEENPDLFWGLRGGGGNFGIVTNFEFQLHPVGPMVLGGLVAYPLEQAKRVLREVTDFVQDIPDDLNAPQQTILGLPLPPLPPFPEEAHGQKVVGLVVFWAGELEDGRREVEPLLRMGDPIGHLIAPMPYTQVQQLGDPLMTRPARNYWKSQCLSGLSEDAIEVIAELAARSPSLESQIIVHLLGGQVARVPVEATAYPHRDTQFEVNIQARWEDAADDERAIGWARDTYEALRPLAAGSYVNTDSGGEPGAAYGSNQRRLVELKQRYDPANLFRLNANIRPTG